MLRSTFAFLAGFAAMTAPLAIARAAITPEVSSPHHQPVHRVAQADPPAPVSPVDPTGVNNTGQTVPNVMNPRVNPASSAVGVGSRGDSVRALQQQLQQRGYYNGPVDGIYGSGTQQAVQSFQQDAGFSQTGQVDPVTGQRLGVTSPGNSGQLPTVPNSTSQAPSGAAAERDVSPGPTGAANAPAQAASRESAAAESATSGEAPAGEGAVPAAGTENSDPEAAPGATAESAQARVEAASEAANGMGRLLWPALALVAALGSFAVGFMLANRGKAGDDVSEEPWGQVSPAVQFSENELAADAPQSISPPLVQSLADGQLQSHTSEVNGKHGSVSAAIATSEAVPSQPIAPVTPISATTKLSKVNIVDELVTDLHVPDPSKRRRAIWELGQRGNSTAIQPLVNAMVDADSKEKSLILAALSEIGIRSLKPMNRALAIALQDENPEVRKNAIRDLTRIYDLVAQISQMLGHASEDEDPEVRRTANWALEQLSRIRQAPDPRNLLSSMDATAKQPDLLSGDITN